MDNLILFLDSFFEVYGEGFVMLILSGILVALCQQLLPIVEGGGAALGGGLKG